METIEKALDAIRSFSGQNLPPAAVDQIKQLALSREQRRDDTQRALDIARFRLDSVRTEGISWQAATVDAIGDFFRGRGLTLMLALVISVAIWLFARGLRALYLKWLYRTPRDTRSHGHR